MDDYGLHGLFLSASYIIEVAVYVWFALCLHIIAKKTDTRHPWLAWIPIANFYLMCKVAGKPGWWTVLLCLPLIFAVPVSFASIMLIFWAMAGEIPAWVMPLFVVEIFLVLLSWALFIIIWMGIAKARNKPSWLGILMIIPIANLVISGILAFSDGLVAGEGDLETV
ncbi:hypothetical protein ACFLTN_00975 [Chloroflexota bacterium]